MLISSLQGSWCSELYAHIKKVLKLHSGEVKLLIISCYFTVCSLAFLIIFPLANLQKDALFIDIANYFVCEATGTLRQCDNPFMELGGDILTILAMVLFGLFPIVNLIYVLNIRELKQKILKQCHARKVLTSARSSKVRIAQTELFLN